jgi:hypothetical protein
MGRRKPLIHLRRFTPLRGTQLLDLANNRVGELVRARVKRFERNISEIRRALLIGTMTATAAATVASTLQVTGGKHDGVAVAIVISLFSK